MVVSSEVAGWNGAGPSATRPVLEARELYRDLGLTWPREAEHYLDSANQPGEGFAVLRVTQEAPHRWRSRLSPHEALVVQKVLDEFPLALEAV